MQLSVVRKRDVVRQVLLPETASRALPSLRPTPLKFCRQLLAHVGVSKHLRLRSFDWVCYRNPS